MIYDSKKQQLILELFRTVTLIAKKLFAFGRKKKRMKCGIDPYK
jgi:hypothetical protein